MPQFTITLTDAAVAKLQTTLTAYNAAHGASLTLRDWILLHLKEIAIQPDLAARAQALEAQSQADLQAAVQAERAAMLTAL